MPRSSRHSAIAISSFLITAFAAVANGLLVAGDWPQILGPDRNGIARDEQLAERWPATGPRQVWDARIGSGFAGVAVSGETAVLFHREENEDKLTAYGAKTGKRLWSTSFPSRFQAQIVEDDGPRSMPVIDKDSIYAYSAEGNLYCVNLKSGDKKWTRHTHADFGATGGYFGAGSTPIVEGSLVIVSVGGDRKKAGIVAFHIDSGETAWTAVNDQASYSSPVAVTLGNTRHLLCITRLNFYSLDPQTGKDRFHAPFGARGPTVNAALPIVIGDHALLTASYGVGSEWLTLGDNQAAITWKNELLSSQYTTPIVSEGLIYGIDGRQDGGPSTLKCIDPQTEKVLWSKPGMKYSTLIGANKQLLIMQTDGVLRMVRLSKDGYDEMGSASLVSGTTRALPALSRGLFYVRNESKLICVDLGEPQK